jgi:hypothetical protein
MFAPFKSLISLVIGKKGEGDNGEKRRGKESDVCARWCVREMRDTCEEIWREKDK